MAITRESASYAKKELAHGALGLSDEEVLELYRKMVVVRTLDERVWNLNRQGKVAIVASGQGHEAAQMGSLLAAMKDGKYFLFTTYRDLALKMMSGLTVQEAMLSYMGKQGDVWSGARQFPLQGAYLKGHIIQVSNVVGTALTQAVGYALACKMLREPTIVMVYFGDGASSQGECHEAMNFASIHKLPVLFVCENNRYAISVPQKLQMAVHHVADRAAGYGFPGVVIDGMDVFSVYRATKEALQYVRASGPMLVEMKVERFMPHTTDDDDRRYRDRGEVEEARKRDPLLLLAKNLKDAGLLTEEQDKELHAQAVQEVNRATEMAEAASLPDPATLYDHLYAP